MRSHLAPCLAAWFTVAVVTQPVLASPGHAASPAPEPPAGADQAENGGSPTDAAELDPGLESPRPDRPALEEPPAADVLVAVDEPEAVEQLDSRRQWVADQLVEIGRSRGEATRSVIQLTEEDLDVLVGNPDMMQAAGTTSVGLTIVIGLLLLGGLLAILAAGEDGFFEQN